ncbi:MAG: hypothetical protein AAGA46_17195 [Cyanobacteria bacterium P01_F01_bin.13]
MAFVTVSPLDTTYGWHGDQYLAGCTSIPEDLAIALGLNQNPSSENDPNWSQKVVQSVTQVEALKLINEATEADAIEVLPGIGPASAGRIFAARPAEGFESIEAVSEVDDLPAAIDWDDVEAWSPAEE